MRSRFALLVVLLIAAAAGGAGAAQAGGEDPRRLQCGQPDRLRLQRFEDGSAKLWCGRRLLAGIAVPW